ncbi:MAG: DNA polymerase III subunit beta [Planctomycetota bacterium]|nr:DNA polymerase III subunit beta [Planctomycetota bacterium]
MKIICDREKLREALAVVNNVIPAKSTKPVLENVCLVATVDAIEILGTDLECSVRFRIPVSDGSGEGDMKMPLVKVIEPGIAVVPSRVTLDFVRDLSGSEVELTTHEQNCVIQSGEDKCELVTVDPDEFPVISSFGDTPTLSIQGGNFTRLVGRTAFAAAREAGRYAMHGVLAEVEDGMLKLVATDGRRLALSTMECQSRPVDRSRPAIVPTKGMQLFCRVITDPLEQVQLHFGENQVGLKTKNAEIFARLIDGEFPRYAAVIPKESGNYIEADPEMLARKLRLVANVTGTEARAVRMRLTPNNLELFGQSVGRGEAHARLDVTFKGAAAEIAFNPDFVLEGLKNCESPVLRLEFNEKTSPGKFTLGENYIYIVMPITVDT